MKTLKTFLAVASVVIGFNSAHGAAQDWPQWLGPDRNAHAADFKAPKSWPKELTEKWKITVGDGVATPALVGDKLYIFSRQDGGEIIRCVSAADGKEIWSDKYDVLPATGPAQNFSGPRSSPVVSDGKVVTLGLRGTVSCYDASNGKLLWRKEDFKGSLPRFFTSSSPLIADGLCVAQLGGNENGGVIAYDLASGDEKWKWTGDGPSYASPALLTVGGTKLVIAEMDKKILGLNLKDGKVLWETPFAVPGRGYNASSPIVNGQTLIYCGSGRGATAVKIEKDGDTFMAKELWKNMDNSVQFNTPIVKNGFLFGLTAGNDFFCINMDDGKTAWVAPLNPPVPAANESSESTGGGGRGGRGRGGRNAGYGSIVDGGSVLIALTPASELIAFEPSGKEFKELARIKVSGTPTYAYPVLSGKRIFIKDQNDVIRYDVE